MFKEMLENVIEHTEGSLGALIMGTDGIAVEKVLGEAGMEANLARGVATVAAPVVASNCETRRRGRCPDATDGE